MIANPSVAPGLWNAHSSAFDKLLLAYLVISGLEIMMKKLQGLVSEMRDLVHRIGALWAEVMGLAGSKNRKYRKGAVGNGPHRKTQRDMPCKVG